MAAVRFFSLFLDNMISLEDLNKNSQENENTSETLPETELLQGLIEENITSNAGSGGLDAVLPQSWLTIFKKKTCMKEEVISHTCDWFINCFNSCIFDQTSEEH